MSNSLTFKIVRKKYIYASYYASDGRLEISTGLTLVDGKETKNVIQKKGRIKYLVDTYIARCEKADEPVYKRDVAKIIIGDINRVRKVKSSALQDVFKRYYDKIVDGTILNDGSPYSPSALKQYSAILGHLKKSGYGAVQIEQFNKEDFEAFTRYLIKRPSSQNTVAVYTTQLMTFFKWTKRKGWHHNEIHLHAEELTVSKEEIDTHIYLTIDEIEAIRKLDLKHPESVRARDLFVFGCYTGLRHIDLSSVGDAQATDQIISITLRKGGNTVHIPMGRVVKELWEKYGGKMPIKTNNNNLIKSIQGFCRKAKINEQTIYTNTVGGKKESKTYPKWELAGTHTMRRSFATNAFKAGVPAVSIMKITGHKTQSSFMKYLRISGQENAELMKAHPFFN